MYYKKYEEIKIHVFDVLIVDVHIYVTIWDVKDYGIDLTSFGKFEGKASWPWLD